MKLSEIFRSKRENYCPLFREFERRTQQPPLSIEKLALKHRLTGKESLGMPIEHGVIGVLQLLYKNASAAILGITEDESGETWGIPQVQGTRSRVSYRVATALQWERFLAHEVHACVKHPEAVVRHITMPPLESITNIDGAASQNVENRYSIVRNVLGMSWSEDEGLWIVDL